MQISIYFECDCDAKRYGDGDLQITKINSFIPKQHNLNYKKVRKAGT